MNIAVIKSLDKVKNGEATILVDFDGVIADTDGTKYAESLPDESMISFINMLYDKGNIIRIFTARGSLSGRDWKSTTKKQLKEWNVKYHELITGKPTADLILDDIAIRPEEILNEI
jgi:CMP-N,N'-diacetyllegionaminic acid synthase